MGVAGRRGTRTHSTQGDGGGVWRAHSAALVSARLRPVLMTVGATVLALFPLALHGGPLWEPLGYTHISGLSVATFLELLLVPVLYAVFVLDLKLITWEAKVERSYVRSTEGET